MVSGMRSIAVFFVIFAAGLGLSTSSAFAQLGVVREVGDVSVVVEAPIELDTARGYAPVIVRARNDGAKSQRLDISLDLGRPYNMSGFRQSSTLRLSPGEEKSIELLVAVDRTENGSGSGRVRFNSAGNGNDVRLPFRNGGGAPHGRVIGLIGPSELSAAELTAFAAALPLEGPSSGRGIYDVGTIRRSSRRSARRPGVTSALGEQAAMVFSLPFEGLLSRTASWSTVDTLIVRTDGPLPEDESWDRVVDWVKMGGQLAFVGAADLDTVRRHVLETDWASPLIQERFRLEVDPSFGAEAQQASIGAFRAGLGSVGIISGADGLASGTTSPVLGDTDFLGLLFTRLDETAQKGATRASTLGEIYRSTYGGNQVWEEAFPEDDLPVRSVLAFLFLFSVLVGPLNVMAARKRKNPSFLFLSVPILSLAATALVVGFGLFHQGFGISGFAHSLSIIDQVEAESTAVMRREMVVGRGGQALEPLPTTVVLVPDHGEDRGTRVLEEDGNQLRLSGNFLPVRARTDHLSFSVESTRARIEWEVEAGGGIRVTNMLGVNLRQLELRALNGDVFSSGGALASGGTKTLFPIEDSLIEAELSDLADPIFGSAVLPKGGYLATAESAGPGIDNCSVNMEEELGVHAIVGYLDDSAARWEGR